MFIYFDESFFLKFLNVFLIAALSSSLLIPGPRSTQMLISVDYFLIDYGSHFSVSFFSTLCWIPWLIHCKDSEFYCLSLKCADFCSSRLLTQIPQSVSSVVCSSYSLCSVLLAFQLSPLRILVRHFNFVLVVAFIYVQFRVSQRLG